MKKIISILGVLLLVGVLFISGCGTKPPETPSTGADQVGAQLGVDNIDNEFDTLDVDDSDFDITDLNNIDTDLDDM